MSKKTVKFYCIKGKHNVNSSDWSMTTFKNKRKAYKAKCPTHGTNLFRIAGKEVDGSI